MNVFKHLKDIKQNIIKHAKSFDEKKYLLKESEIKKLMKQNAELEHRRIMDQQYNELKKQNRELKYPTFNKFMKNVKDNLEKNQRKQEVNLSSLSVKERNKKLFG